MMMMSLKVNLPSPKEPHPAEARLPPALQESYRPPEQVHERRCNPCTIVFLPG